MRKTTFLKSCLLLVAMLLGVNSAWADEVTLAYPNNTNTTTNMTGTNDAAMVGLSAADWSVVGYKGSANNFPGLNKAGQIRLYYNAAGSNYITISSLTGATINSIKATYGTTSNNKAIVKVGNVIIDDTNDEDAIGEYTINNSSFTIENGYTANTQLYILSLLIKYTPSASPKVSTPTFSPAAGAVLSGTTVTISTTTDRAKIYYTTDGTAPTQSSTIFGAPITITKDVTIKARAYYDNYNPSEIATAEYTILSMKSISEVRALTNGDKVYTEGVCTSVNGKTAYIQDLSAAIAVYNSAKDLDVKAGDKFYVQGTLGEYYKLLQIQNPVITEKHEGNEIPVEVMTIAQVNENATVKQGWYVKIENAKVTAINNNNVTIAQGENTLTVRFNKATDITFEKDNYITLEGNISCYNNTTQIANPTNVTIIPSEDPIIKAEDVTIDYDVTAGEIAYTIENPSEATLTAEITEGDWVYNIGYATGKVTFDATLNEGLERTAKITLKYTGADDKIVTITQKKFGYAALPFAFDGGINDIQDVYGLTQDGLGSDYSQSPKLKFNDSGDNLILRINEAANALSFDIKGNSFSGGNFTVQTSTDGTVFKNLVDYTELENTNKETKLLRLESNVRYIKWVYTKKDAGNVGIGNIKVFNGEFVTIPASKYLTFASTKAIDFTGSGITAYTAKATNKVVVISEIDGNIVPANAGVLLKAEAAGTYAGALTDGGGALSDDNELIGVTVETVVPWESGDKRNYILQNGKFYKATGAKLKAGRAYLSSTYDITVSDARLDIVIDGETNAIANVRSQMEDVRGIFNLQGQRVEKAQKGLYIVNGKKVLVK